MDAERGQLHQVLSNLCENAQRYSRGMPRIRLTYGIDSSIYAYIDVADTGPGVAAAIMPQLFEPFSSGRGGLGLGLYVSRELSRANGGSLLLAENTASGAVFRLRVKRGDSR